MRLDVIKLRIVMIKREITQTELAKVSGISRPTICAICCGRSCRPETGERIAEALGVTVEELKEER